LHLSNARKDMHLRTNNYLRIESLDTKASIDGTSNLNLITLLAF